MRVPICIRQKKINLKRTPKRDNLAKKKYFDDFTKFLDEKQFALNKTLEYLFFFQ